MITFLTFLLGLAAFGLKLYISFRKKADPTQVAVNKQREVDAVAAAPPNRTELVKDLDKGDF